VFYEHFKESYSSLLLVENCCEHFDSFIQHLENIYGVEEFMDKEIIEALYDNSFQHQEETIENQITHLDLNDNI